MTNKKTMKNATLIFSLLIALICFSCSDDSASDEWKDFAGTYEFYDEDDDNLIEVRITIMGETYFWDLAGSGPQLIILEEDNIFKVREYENWGYWSKVTGELKGDTMSIVHEVFELEDLVNPVTISERDYIKRK